MRHRTQPRHRRRLPATLFLIFAGLIYAHIDERFSFRARDERKITDDVVAANSSKSEELGEVSEHLLLDAILSIIQSYYVDSERTTNDHLIAVTMSSLAALTSELRFTETPAMLELLYQNQEGIQVPLNASMTYEQMTQHYQDLVRFCKKINLSHLIGKYTLQANDDVLTLVLNATLSGLDPHSALLTPDAYRELRQGTEGAFGGLGILVGNRDHLLTVIKPMPHSPAIRAGVKRQDKILSINGVSTFGYSLDQLVELMRGDPGTVVDMTILREKLHAPLEFHLKREIINVDSVEVHEHRLSSGASVLRVAIESFSSRTAREVLEAIKKARQKGKFGGLILDLRSNPGGLLDQAVQVSDLFLQSGIIVTTKGRHEEVERAGRGYDEMDFPIVVLINGDSASASEIVAGALHDHNRAVVIGQPSFGKGSVQTIFELPAERALKLTIARYYTPLGRSIQNVGITPDIWLQPIAKAEENRNLLGSLRYKTEQSLRNHLLSTEHVQSDLKAEASLMKAYYLQELKDPQSFDADPSSDTDIDVALTILKKIYLRYSGALPEGARHASHWLALAGPEIKQQLAQCQKSSEKFLENKWHIDWSQGNRNDNLKIRIMDDNNLKAIPGEKVYLKWEVHNLSSQPAHLVSVFLRSTLPGFETYESLIGKIDGGASVRGQTEVVVPIQWNPGPLPLIAGVACDSSAVSIGIQNFDLNILPRSFGTVAVNSELEDDRTRTLQGVLESGEKARLILNVTNASQVPISNAHLRVQNLSGEQLHIGPKDFHFDLLRGGESAKAIVPVEGAESITAGKLSVGVVIESNDLGPSFVQQLDIPSAPDAGHSTEAKLSH